MNFKEFKRAVQARFKWITEHCNQLFISNVNRDTIYQTYLDSFANSEEKQEHTCHCCRSFLKNYANVVGIVNNELVSIWQVVNNDYQVIANNLHILATSAPIAQPFITKIDKLGTDSNKQLLESGQVTTWEHFHLVVPSQFITHSSASVEAVMGDLRTSKEVFKRSLEELSIEAAETILELTKQGSLYKGAEFKPMVEQFLKYKKEYSKLSDIHKDNYAWANFKEAGNSVARIRNTAIGTLLINLSNGIDLDHAVQAFERVVAPTNYKRPTALVTPAMITKAQQTLTELGYMDSLSYRHAKSDDITVNNILFVDRAVKLKDTSTLSMFDALKQQASGAKLGKTEELPIEDFIKNVLPTLQSLEIMVENSHINNLFSLTAPVNKEAKPLFKWGNNFGWAYNGNITDSIKEKVKVAGGNVNGVLRVSLAWHNQDDLDLHCIEPNGNEISFRDKHSTTTGFLDVDIIHPVNRNAVENIAWTDVTRMKEGVYKVFVNNYNKRENQYEGFTIELECGNQLYTFEIASNGRGKEDIDIVTFDFSKSKGITIINSKPTTKKEKDIWNIKTNMFQKVQLVMNSPNHWSNPSDSKNDLAIGNKHYFFVIANCLNPDSPNGFFNEFISDDLKEVRKAMELIASKLKVPYSDEQLSGIGFSSTMRNSVVVKAIGTFERTIKLLF